MCRSVCSTLLFSLLFIKPFQAVTHKHTLTTLSNYGFECILLQISMWHFQQYVSHMSVFHHHISSSLYRKQVSGCKQHANYAF